MISLRSRCVCHSSCRVIQHVGKARHSAGERGQGRQRWKCTSDGRDQGFAVSHAGTVRVAPRNSPRRSGHPEIHTQCGRPIRLIAGKIIVPRALMQLSECFIRPNLLEPLTLVDGQP